MCKLLSDMGGGGRREGESVRSQRTMRIAVGLWWLWPNWKSYELVQGCYTLIEGEYEVGKVFSIAPKGRGVTELPLGRWFSGPFVFRLKPGIELG